MKITTKLPPSQQVAGIAPGHPFLTPSGTIAMRIMSHGDALGATGDQVPCVDLRTGMVFCLNRRDEVYPRNLVIVEE